MKGGLGLALWIVAAGVVVALALVGIVSLL